MTNSNDLFGILILVAILYAVYYFANDCKHPYIPNEDKAQFDKIGKSKDSDLTDQLVNQYRPPNNEQSSGSTFEARDEYDNVNGSFEGLPKKDQIDKTGKMDKPFNTEDTDNGVFVYRDTKFGVSTVEEAKAELNSDNYLPKQQKNDWFDVEPIQGSKKIRGTHFIHPKVWNGVNTVGSSLRNASYDLRGNVPTPKINVSIWNNSTIDPDTNIMGICNPV